MRYTRRNNVAEWTFESSTAYGDPFNEVSLDVVFADPDGDEYVMPAFWAGEQAWRVRYAPEKVGSYSYRSVCSDAGNADLHGQTGAFEALPYEGANPLLKHGRLRAAADERHLEHADGTPFFWLGDTWWMGFTKRLPWPAGFQELTTDRVAKGFSLVQIVAGLYPDMPPFDERGANEAGFPWDPEFKSINPSYFDMADLRIAHLVRSGLVPCIVGMWGYFLAVGGQEMVKKHWRNLVARYAAYPVVWCAAGEATMTYYLDRPKDAQDAAERLASAQATWSEVVRSIRAADPYGNPITIHPTRFGREQVDDPSVLDLEMLQTGHGGYPTLSANIDTLADSLGRDPKMPVFVSEVCYEGIMESSREEIQRFLFWSSMLTGACGHTYGANGIWQVNSRKAPFGKSPHGTAWGNLPWEDAYQLPGSGQLGLGKKLLERYPWNQFETHLEWVEPHQTEENRLSCYAAGIPGKVRVIYIPAMQIWSAWSGNLLIKGLEAGAVYQATLFDPKLGTEHDLGAVSGDDNGDWPVPKPPIFQDYVLILEK